MKWFCSFICSAYCIFMTALTVIAFAYNWDDFIKAMLVLNELSILYVIAVCFYKTLEKDY